jgi:hypothetical protein
MTRRVSVDKQQYDLFIYIRNYDVLTLAVSKMNFPAIADGARTVETGESNMKCHNQLICERQAELQKTLTCDDYVSMSVKTGQADVQA